MSSEDGKAHLVFIPLPVMSHLAAAVNVATLITARDNRLSVTVLLFNVQTDTKISSFIQNPPSSTITFLQLPRLDPTGLDSTSRTFILQFVHLQKSLVKDALAQIIASGPARLAGVVLDMFCSTMIDVAKELTLPTYLLFTSSAAALGLFFHLGDGGQNRLRLTEADKSSGRTVPIPTLSHPIPLSLLPERLFHEDGDIFLDLVCKFKNAKGILINTCFELERHAISSLADDVKLPQIFPIGPILQSSQDEINDKNDETIRWLEDQPDSSVVFLCFGTNGWFNEIDQVREIARALQNSGHRFLWSLRKPPTVENVGFPGEYDNFGEVLPTEFLERTAGVGRVVGWAPQVAILSHRAVGAFISHCGWNSVLESIWYGVPAAAWPQAAEQQVNAFQMVNEFGIAVEVRLDYRRGDGVVVTAEEIEVAVQQLMAAGDGRREKVRMLKEESRRAVMEGGSSWNNLGRWIDSVINATDCRCKYA